jgi:ribosomal-protein-alanine N-acetyltransferase
VIRVARFPEANLKCMLVFVGYDGFVDSKTLVALDGPRTHVRELEPRDVETLLELAGDPEVRRFTHWTARTRDELTAFVERSGEARAASPRIAYGLAVDERATGETVGFLRLTITSVEHEQAELGAFLLRRHWGKGFATELGAVIRTFAFGELHVHRLACHCDTENVASMRVLEKLGFVREGTIRHRLRSVGVWRDSHLYATLASG